MDTSTKFIQALHSGRVLLMDGAMGTELGRAGIQPGECYEQWNLTHPDRVLAIHRAYVEAGAEVLLTNTFQANPAALAKHDLQNLLEPILRAGVDVARQSISSGYILGDVGPCQENGETLQRLAPALNNVDGVLLETMSDLRASSVAAIKRNGNLAVFFSCAFLQDANGNVQTYTGLTPEAVARQANDLGVAALGVNCGRDIDMDDIIEIVHRYRSATALPLFARPNAGTPAKVDGQWVYPHTPEKMAAKLPELLKAGVSMIGGCCGTTPAHIAAFKPIVDEWNRSTRPKGA